MKILKQLLFGFAVTICFSITASAQKQDDKKPKNPDPPKIVVAPKEGDKEKPKGNNQPKDDKKKPNSAYFKSSNKDEITSV
jgi:hypothetical protein